MSEIALNKNKFFEFSRMLRLIIFIISNSTDDFSNNYGD